jgi:hypothetical protein
MLHPRTRDYLFLAFLLVHIPATLLVDLQALFFAERIAPRALKSICEYFTICLRGENHRRADLSLPLSLLVEFA